jgi:hypothetical protein
MSLIPSFKSLRPSRQTAVRQQSGTTYQAKGPNLSAADYHELGSQRGSRIVDPVPQLGNRSQARLTYARMSRSDASVRVSLRAAKAPVLGAEFYVDPFSDDEQDLVIQELVEYNLFEGMTTSWLSFLEQALHMFRDGFSAFEPVWELREWAPRATAPGSNLKKYTMLRKLAVRPPETVADFEYDDNGGPVGITQNALRSDGTVDVVPIPIEKLCVFTFDKDGGDLQGNSILRSAYEHWYYKDHLYKIDAIQKERHGIGIPDIELQPGFSVADKKFAHELGKNMRTNEFSYIVRTPQLKVGFAELKGQLVDALESANHHDMMIMKNIMVQFLNMGVGSSSNRSTSATAMDMFLKAMKYIANIYCEGINLYVIPNLVTYNFKTDRFPKLQVRNIGEAKDLQQWAAAMANLIGKEAIIVDDATEQWIRKQMDMPKRTTPFEEGRKKPTLITEQIKDPTAAGDAVATKGATTKNGQVQTGNIGKSPSSGT